MLKFLIKQLELELVSKGSMMSCLYIVSSQLKRLEIAILMVFVRQRMNVSKRRGASNKNDAPPFLLSYFKPSQKNSKRERKLSATLLLRMMTPCSLLLASEMREILSP